jgi:hypothetical protein
VAHPRKGWDLRAIRSYVSNLRKHDRNILDGLRLLFDAQIWLPTGS